MKFVAIRSIWINYTKTFPSGTFSTPDFQYKVMLGNQLPVLTYSRQFMKESLNSDKIGDANEKIERMLYCYDTISA